LERFQVYLEETIVAKMVNFVNSVTLVVVPTSKSSVSVQFLQCEKLQN